MLCPCYSARLGAFLLAVAACVAGAPLFFGLNLSAVLVRVGGGDPTVFAIAAVIFVLYALAQLVLGLRAALSHDDDFSLWSFLLSVGLALLIVRYGGEATAGMRTEDAAWTHTFFVGLLADCAINVWLQIRGFLPRRRRVYDPSLAFLMRDQHATIARLIAERDRAVTEGGREGEAATLLKVPGVARAILSALHPDRVKADADRRIATERFQTASSVLDKLGARR